MCSQLEITGEPFFESVVNLTKFFWNLGNGLLREKVNKTDWRTHAYAAVINAFYDFMENSLSKYLIVKNFSDIFTTTKQCANIAHIFSST